MNIQDFITEFDPTPIPEDWLWERIRIWRDNELKASDWTQLPDAPVDATAWAAYRQNLRDLPGSATTPSELVFPVKP